MDIFEFVLSVSIDEGVASAREKYVKTGDISKRHFGRLVEGDPSKNKKYVEWMCKIATISPWTDEKIVQIVQLFDILASKGYIKNPDIYQYDTLEEVEKVLEQPKLKAALRTTQKEREKDVQVLINNSEVLIVFPRTAEAMMKYGRGTRWCVTNPEDFLDYAEYEYTKIYVVIDKKGTFGKPGEKFAVSVYGPSPTVWNEKDKWLASGKPSSETDKRRERDFFSWLGFESEEEAVKELFNPFTEEERQEIVSKIKIAMAYED